MTQCAHQLFNDKRHRFIIIHYDLDGKLLPERCVASIPRGRTNNLQATPRFGSKMFTGRRSSALQLAYHQRYVVNDVTEDSVRQIIAAIKQCWPLVAYPAAFSYWADYFAAFAEYLTKGSEYRDCRTFFARACCSTNYSWWQQRGTRRKLEAWLVSDPGLGPHLLSHVWIGDQHFCVSFLHNKRLMRVKWTGSILSS